MERRNSQKKNDRDRKPSDKKTFRGRPDKNEKTFRGKKEEPTFKKKTYKKTDSTHRTDDSGVVKKTFKRTIPGNTGPKSSFEKSEPRKISRSRTNDGSIRLNKYIASTGASSRREADEMIVAGLIQINGEVVAELGSKVMPGDDVRINGERLKKEKMVYVLLNKPKDYVTTAKDPFAKQTVLDLVKDACRERIYPVGRLDRNTTGVLLLTNDGDLTRKLTHPSFNKKKIYHVFLDKNVKHEDLIKISEGFDLEDGFIKADEVHYVDPVEKNQVGIEIHSGRNHIVRRIFEHLGYKVEKLDRVYFAGLTKKGLQRGHWRILTDQEIGVLKMGNYE